MDHKYAYSAVSFLIGVAAGVKDVSSRYPADAIQASRTPPGLAYLASRGALPAVLFATAYYNQWVTAWLFLVAAAFGVGAEVFLRSQFLVRQSAGPNGGIDELLKGPLDLLRWYQDKCLGSIDTTRARKRREFIKNNLPDEEFLVLCDRVLTNQAAFVNENPTLVAKIDELKSEYEKTDKSAAVNKRCGEKLGYKVLHLVGEKNFITLFKSN